MKQQLKAHAPGLTVRQALDKLSGMQLLDVHFPTVDGRELIFTRYTEPEADQQLLSGEAGLDTAATGAATHYLCCHRKNIRADVVQTFDPSLQKNQALALVHTLSSEGQASRRHSA